jgi:hypothetical protein
MSKSFYDQAKELDYCKVVENPSGDQIDLVLSLIYEDKFAKYFFQGLDNPAWIDPLYEAGYFQNPPDPIEVKPGYYQLPTWPAGEFLARFASDHEDIIVDLMQHIRTENWRVLEILIDALIKISPQSTIGLIRYIDPWYDGRFSDMLPIKLSKLATHLLDAGFPEAAVEILESTITPTLPSVMDVVSKYHSDLRFRSDHYWVNEYCENQLPKLTRIIPSGVVTAFARQLEKAIELTKHYKNEDAEFWVGHVWRMDIPNRISERRDADALDILIDGLRDGLLELCKQSPEEGNQFLADFLSNDHIIFKRIALYTLRFYGQKYPAILEKALLERDYFLHNEYATEYRGLLRDQFGTISDSVRTQVMSWILEGPFDIESREVTDEDKLIFRERWILYHLEILREYLTGDMFDRLTDLESRYGKPDIEERPHIVTTSWGGAPSPVPTDELAQKNFDDLKELFRVYVPDDLFLNPRESLAETFQTIVRDNPDKYNDFALKLIDPKIRSVYTYHFLSGIREGLKKGKGSLNDAIISLCEYVVVQDEDPFIESSGDYEPGLFAAQLEVARLIAEALKANDPYLSRELLDRIRALLITLANHPDPENEDKSSFDPFTKSLNCVRGVTMHAIMHYSLYLIRQRENSENVKLSRGFLESEIQSILEQKLDKTKEPSPAVHSVFGAFTPQLHYLDRDWLEKHLNKIYPETEHEFVFWKAAWDAYLFASNVYKDVFRLLIPQYQRGLQKQSFPLGEEKYLRSTPNERLAQHIMFAYLADMTDFNHENELFDLFYRNAPDPIRATGVFWLSKVLEEQKPEAGDKLWQKLWTLWQNRIQAAEKSDPSQNSQEISDYMRWLDNCPANMNILFPTLRISVKYFTDGFDVRLLNAYAAKQCEKFPLEAVTLLRDTILSAKDLWWSPKEEDEERILRAALASNIPEAKEIALEVINFRGESGDFRWKTLIE